MHHKRKPVLMQQVLLKLRGICEAIDWLLQNSVHVKPEQKGAEGFTLCETLVIHGGPVISMWHKGASAKGKLALDPRLQRNSAYRTRDAYTWRCMRPLGPHLLSRAPWPGNASP
eukprot:3262730-Amphidinium_carterae.1